jgi:hypothetical protein
MERYFNGRWKFFHDTGEIVHVKSHYKHEGVTIDKSQFDVIIPQEYLNELIDFMDKQNMIKPKMDDQSRAEDLKIVHRLLDITEKMAVK